MNRIAQEEHLKMFQTRQQQIMLKKGNDYANEDRLSNFKKVAEICQCRPIDVAMISIAIKVVRLGNLISKGDGVVVENESITDTLIDLSSYSAIADSILFEEKKEA